MLVGTKIQEDKHFTISLMMQESFVTIRSMYVPAPLPLVVLLLLLREREGRVLCVVCCAFFAMPYACPRRTWQLAGSVVGWLS